MENEEYKFVEPQRAKRRRLKERKVQEAFRRKLKKSWRRTQPEEYWILDPNDEEDMLDIWSMDTDHIEPYSDLRNHGSDWVIYIIGKGVINPPEEDFDPFWGDMTERLPYLNEEDIIADLMLEAKKIANHQAACSCDMCGNPRKNGFKIGKSSDHRAFKDAIDQFEEEELFVEKSRLKRRFTKNGH